MALSLPPLQLSPQELKGKVLAVGDSQACVQFPDVPADEKYEDSAEWGGPDGFSWETSNWSQELDEPEWSPLDALPLPPPASAREQRSLCKPQMEPAQATPSRLARRLSQPTAATVATTRLLTEPTPPLPPHQAERHPPRLSQAPSWQSRCRPRQQRIHQPQAPGLHQGKSLHQPVSLSCSSATDSCATTAWSEPLRTHLLGPLTQFLRWHWVRLTTT